MRIPDINGTARRAPSLRLLALLALASAAPAVAGTPGITLTVSSTTTEISAAGQSIQLDYLVSNTGEETLSDLSIAEYQVSVGVIACSSTTLAPQATTTCSVTYVATQDDMDDEGVLTLSRASAVTPGGMLLTSAESQVYIPATQVETLSLTISTTPTFYQATGDVIAVAALVRNTGNVTVRSVSGPWPITGCAETTLAPGATTLCTGSFAVATFYFGRVATVGGVAAGNTYENLYLTSAPSYATVVYVDPPRLALRQSTTSTGFSAVGEIIDYRLIITPGSTDPVNDIVVNDSPFLEPPVTCSGNRLNPPSAITCTFRHTVTQADLDGGTLYLSAAAQGMNSLLERVFSSGSDIALQALAAPAINLATTVSPASARHAGDVLSYRYSVTNTGNLTLTDLAVSDQHVAPSSNAALSAIVCPVSTLAPGDSTTCTASYTVGTDDIAHGSITSHAGVSATSPQGAPVSSAVSTVNVTAGAAIAIPIPALTAMASALLGLLLAWLGLRHGPRRRA